MKFLISRELIQGKYCVKVILQEFSEVDRTKADKFGMPRLSVKSENGTTVSLPINQISHFPPFGFNNANEADDYVIKLKDKINELKKSWETLKDTWSKQEVI